MLRRSDERKALYIMLMDEDNTVCWRKRDFPVCAFRNSNFVHKQLQIALEIFTVSLLLVVSGKRL